MYYLQSRYYNPKTGRFLNADAFATTGQGILGNNMFAYCENNPVARYDPTGLAWQAIVAKVVICAAVNLGTSYIAAKVTNQQFTFKDGFFAALSGGVSAVSPVIGGLIAGSYTGINSYQNGGGVGGSILSGGISFLFTAFSMGGVAELLEEPIKIGVKSIANWMSQAFVNTVFSLGYNSMSAAVYKGVMNNRKNVNACPWESPYYSPYS